MKFKRWIPLGSLILLMCAQQGDATLILGSMLMAATAAMTGGLIMGPLTIGGLIMMMMMAANQQAGNQRQAGSANLATTLESSQNLLNLLSSLTGAASNLATSASTQSSQQKASKRHLYSPQNLDELLAISSRNTASNRQWKSMAEPTAQPKSTTTYYGSNPNDDFWNPKATFSPNGFAVQPIPDDLLDIAMRFPSQPSRPTERSYSHLFAQSTTTPTTSTTSRPTTSGPPFDTSDVIRRMMDLASPHPFTSSENMRWVASEPGDLFSSFPEVKEEDFLSLVKKRATREVLSSKFRLEDIANVTYANFQDPAVKQQLSERERQDVVNTRIFRQLSALDPLRCLPQLACNLQATPPSQKSGIMNDYAYLLKTVFERDDDEDADDEEEDKNPNTSTKGVGSTKTKGTSSSSSKNKGVAGSIASDIATLIKAASSSSGKKKLNYHSPGKTNKGKKGGKGDDDKEENDDVDDEGFSSEEIPMNDEELDRLMMKEQYEMERLANEQLLDDDPNMLPYVLKSASKAPPYLGPDKRYDGTIGLAQEIAAEEAMLAQGGGRRGGGNEYPSPYFRDMSRSGVEGGEFAEEAYAQPEPLFSVAKLNRLRPEELDRMSSGELNQLLKQVSYPGTEHLRYDAEPEDDSIGAVLANYMPKLPEISIGFTRRRTTGNAAFDDDPFFDDFELKKRSLGPAPKNVRVVKKTKAEGQIARRMAYLRSMRKQIAAENDSAKIFKMANAAGAKVKSARQCRFLFNTCPMNSTQLMGMIGNIRNAVINLSNPQQLINGLQTTTPSPAKDVVGTLATIGPNIVKFQPSDIPASAPAPTQAPVPSQVHQLQPIQLQMHTPSMQMMPSNTHSHSQSTQNTLVVPQIIQVPMPIHTQSQNPAPQQVIIHSPQSHPQYQQQMPQYQQQMSQYQQQMPQQQQQQRPQMMAPAPAAQSQGNYNRHPIFNIAANVGSGSDSSSGLTSISSELPSGEKFEISMQLPGSQRPSIPQSASSAPSTLTSLQRNKDTAAALVDLFDDDNSDNYLLPTKSLIETEIKQPPTTALDSLQAAILAIEKINEAADRAKVKQQDDEREQDFKINQKLEASLKRPIKALPSKKVPAGLRLPNKKDKPEDDGDEDDSSEEDEDEDEDDEDSYRALPNAKSREFITVPTKNAQFGSTLTVPSTQTFVKKTLQVAPVPNPNRRMGYNSASSEENNYRNLGHRYPTHHSGSSEEYQQTMQYNRRKVRRPKILYPQESMEKPLFIPL